jgi:hypothetical protein
MKLKDIVKRIDLQRESTPRHLLPFDNFLEKISSAGKLLWFVEENTKDKKLRLEARKYFVVVCVSCMETYFRVMAAVFIDAGWVKEGFLNSLGDTKVTLSDLSEITKRKISIGEIVSVSYSFQTLETINRVYTKMLSVSDFMSEVEAFKVETEHEESVLEQSVLKDRYPDFRRKIEEMIKLRHLIVHHEGFRTLGLERLGQMWENLHSFVTAADDYLLQKVPEATA